MRTMTRFMNVTTTTTTTAGAASLLLIVLILASTCFTLSLSAAANVNAAAIPKQWLSNAASFAAGGVGGVCSVLVGHPFDLVKVRQQTAVSSSKDDDDNNNNKDHPVVTPTNRGTIGTLRNILATEGIRGMYRGVSAPIVAVAPIWATSFWGFDTGTRLIRWFCHSPADQSLTLLQLCLAGGFSALPTSLVMVPCERIKCILQTQQEQQHEVQPQRGRGKQQRVMRGGANVTTKSSSSSNGRRRYNGFRDCARSLYAETGLGGLYKGTTLTLMRDVPGNMVYFGVYTLAKQHLPASMSPTATALVAGALAGISFWPVVLPMDCLKSRYQAAPEGTYKNIGQVYSELMEQEGLGGMFRGMKPAMMRSAPANAVSFLGAEVTKSALSKFF